MFRRLPPSVRRNLVRAGTPGYTVGAVVAVQCQGRLLMLRQPHREGWSLPGGLLDRGEGAGDGAAREVLEETGVAVRLGLPATAHVNPVLRRVDIIYVVRFDTEPSVTVGGEAQDYAWLKAEDVTEKDGPTEEILATLRQLRERERDAQ